jgi:hypothetical protein
MSDRVIMKKVSVEGRVTSHVRVVRVLSVLHMTGRNPSRKTVQIKAHCPDFTAFQNALPFVSRFHSHQLEMISIADRTEMQCNLYYTLLNLTRLNDIAP